MVTFRFMRPRHVFSAAALSLTVLTACLESSGSSFVMYDLASVNGVDLPAQSSSGGEITRGVLTLFDHDLSFALGITVSEQGTRGETSWSDGGFVDTDSTVQFTIREIDGIELGQEIVLTGTRDGDAIVFDSQEGDEYHFRKWTTSLPQ